MTDFTTVKKNLESKRFHVSAFATAEEAADYLDRSIDGVSVGIGGSVTAEQMGLYENCPDTTGCSGTGVRSRRRTPAERP